MHGTHTEAFVVGPYVPAGQARQVAGEEAPGTVEYVPVGQPTQTLAVEAPCVTEYDPVGHSVQLVALYPSE
jgi:hypothetical protein